MYCAELHCPLLYCTTLYGTELHFAPLQSQCYCLCCYVATAVCRRKEDLRSRIEGVGSRTESLRSLAVCTEAAGRFYSIFLSFFFLSHQSIFDIIVFSPRLFCLSSFVLCHSHSSATDTQTNHMHSALVQYPKQPPFLPLVAYVTGTVRC
jgi:hypothetical protein